MREKILNHSAKKFSRVYQNITASDIPEIVKGLRKDGGRKGFLLANKLCRHVG